jgi:GNAT superfamily N-acetyltransferase
MPEAKTWTVRVALVDDAEAIATIHVDSWRAIYRGLMPDKLLARLSIPKRCEGRRRIIAKGRACLVLERGGIVIGFADYGPSEESGEGEIYAMYLNPSRWRQGGGKLLYTAALEGLRAEGFSTLEIGVLEGNRIARSFYEKQGLELVANSRKMIRFSDADLPHLLYRGKI